ncbi:MAG: tRNA (adenosine(37)-N6)-threonylcarbamoyltransferase complex ATPase subunit type 1 TsaE [Candidatus Omnitrophica bacterium]|nr:tRNA (adenosine(37)-N6)-threonylcarbamoyltransferase complex ATPase subunit type 1 TsaE [Candidatus Omnitrophota bacterium]
MKKSITSNKESETVELGKRLGRIARSGDIIALFGELGSGKTVLAKGIALGLGVKRPDRVNSPTFVILKEYAGRIPLYHFDVYRLTGAADFSTVGYSEYFYGKGISVIEWADKVAEALPREVLKIELSVDGDKRRKVTISSSGKRYDEILRKL